MDCGCEYRDIKMAGDEGNGPFLATRCSTHEIEALQSKVTELESRAEKLERDCEVYKKALDGASSAADRYMKQVAEVEARESQMKPVVDAALAWKNSPLPQDETAQEARLSTAVERYRDTLKNRTEKP